MKTLIKKSLLVLMLVFVSVFALGLNTKVRAAEVWQLVTDASSLAAGDEVIIVAKDAAYALSTTQNGNNRGQTSITKSADGSSIETISASVQVFTLQAGTVDSTFAFYTGSGYIYAASSSKNYLRTETTLSANSSWSITITDTVATIKAQGTNTRNWLRYNSTSSIFATYASGQKDVCLYKKVTVSSSEPKIVISSSSSSVTVGNTLTINSSLENFEGTPTLSWETTDSAVATIENGVVTAHKVGTTTVMASANGVSSNVVPVTVYPVENSELTIAEALQVCELTGSENSPYTYSTTGVIESIDTAYSSTYENITVTITDGTNSIQAYQMAGGEELVEGDKIKVTGILVNYQGNTPEFVKGCTYEAVADDADTAAAKEALNAVQAYFQLAYTYDVTSVTESAVSSATITFDSTSKRTSFSTESQVWEENGITVTNAKGSSTTNVADYAAPVRFYKSSSVTIEFTSPFKSIVVTCNTADYATALAGATVTGATLSANGTVVTIDLEEAVSSLSITMPAQVRVDSLTVECESSGTQTVDKYSNVDFRVRCGVDASIADIENVDDYGIYITTSTGKEHYYSSEDVLLFTEDGKTYVTLDLGDALNTSSLLSLEFTVSAYVVIDGITYTPESTPENVKTHSIASMVKEYYGMAEYTSLVQGLYNILDSKGLITE